MNENGDWGEVIELTLLTRWNLSFLTTTFTLNSYRFIDLTGQSDIIISNLHLINFWRGIQIDAYEHSVDNDGKCFGIPSNLNAPIKKTVFWEISKSF